MTPRFNRLLAACVAAALVGPTMLVAQQPTKLQLYNINAGAVGGRWLLNPGTATSGLYNIAFPNTSGTLIASSAPLTANQLMATDGSGNASTFALSNGGMVYGTGTAPTLLVAGAANSVLRMNGTGTAPEWDAASDFAWLIGGNASPSDNDLGTTTADALNIVTNNTARISIAAGGAITATSAVTLNTGGAADLTLDETSISRAGNIAINPGAGNDINSDGGLVVNENLSAAAGNFTVAITTGNTDINGTLTVDGATTLGDADADATTIRGTINLNTSNSAGANVNINSSALANTTTIGNNTASNTINLNAPVVNAPNLPTGAATDNLVTVAGGALRTASVSTMLGGTAWLLGGNTITGSNTTLILGIAAQAGSEDNLAIQTDGTTRLTFGGTGGMTAATTLDMTNNAISNIGAAGTDFSATGGLTLAAVLTVSPTSNQIVLGTTNTTTVSATAPAASRIYTMPDVGANANFVMTEGGQAVNGDKNFTGDITFGATGTSTGGNISLHDENGGSDFVSTITQQNLATNRAYSIIDAGADASFVMTEGTQTINGSKTHLGTININNSSSGTTGIGNGTSTGTVTIGNSANSTVFGSEIAHTPTNQAGINAAATLASFTTSFERVTITEGGAAYNVTLPAGTNGQIVYLRLSFVNAGGTNPVTVVGDGGAPNFFTWAGTADEVYLMHMIWDITAGEWQVIATTLQP